MKQNDAQHWAKQSERGSFLLMRFTLWITQVLGRRLTAPLLYLIVLYFFLTGRVARHSIREYYAQLTSWTGNAYSTSSLSIFRQFLAFAESILDKLDVWHGRLGLNAVQIHDPHGIRAHIHAAKGRGQLLVGAHLGNLDVCRALAERNQIKMNVLVHTAHAERINGLINANNASNLRLIQVSQLDTAIMLQLSQRLDAGEWLAIAGDRVPLQEGRRSEGLFMGKTAVFPQGPWLLAGLLQCPVNLFFCLKIKGRYQIYLESFVEAVSWQRKTRQQVLDAMVQKYADRLAAHCVLAPQQWFNFYPFWKANE